MKGQKNLNPANGKTTKPLPGRGKRTTENPTNDEFVKNVTKNVAPGSTLIVGVSGGPDSMYLLHRCMELSENMRLKLIVAHVNHGLRDKESDVDEKFVKEVCEKNGLKFKNLRINLKKSRANVEEAGRDARYNFFETLRKQHKATWILTAHHLNDNIETMLFNLIRGAHLSGIKAMEVTSPARHLMRPMIGIPRKEILEYLKKHRIKSRQDSSNENLELSRNWLRKKIIPLFKNINPNFEKTFKETLHNLAQTSGYLEHQSVEWLKKHSSVIANNLHISLNRFVKEHPAFQKHLLVHLYKKIHGSTNKLTNKHLEEILKVLHLQRGNVKKEFGGKTFLEVVREPDISWRTNRAHGAKATCHPQAEGAGARAQGSGSAGPGAYNIRLITKK